MGRAIEIAESEEHPTAEEVTEEAVFPDQAEVLPRVADMLWGEGAAGDPPAESAAERKGRDRHDEEDLVVEIDLPVE